MPSFWFKNWSRSLKKFWVVVVYKRALGTVFDWETKRLFTKWSLTEDGRLWEVVVMRELTVFIKSLLSRWPEGWGGGGVTLNAWHDKKGLFILLRSSLYGYHWWFMTFIRAGWQPLSVNSSAAWVLQMKTGEVRNDASSSTMGEEKRESAEASKRNVTNKSLSPHLPSKSKWEKKHVFFLVVMINFPLLATNLRDEAPSCGYVLVTWNVKKSLS